MRKAQLLSLLASAMIGIGGPALGQFEPRKPEVFARAEDQRRARLLTTRCREADVGRGCYRYDNRLIREAPCTYHVEKDVIASLPTGKCYKMEAARRYRGVWIDEFEGQRFIPEGAHPPEWPRSDPKSPGWKEQFEQARLATIWLDARRVAFDKGRRHNGKKWFIEFLGRKTLYAGAYGHFGMSGHEIIVDRVISLRECPSVGVCR